MSTSFEKTIRNDLKESRIDWKVMLAFVPIAFFTYLFHESGHWLLGELSGNDMTLSLNHSDPKSGFFQDETDALWSAIGGPLFTILQAFVFLLFIRQNQSVYAYSMMFFAVFSRFFSLVFGGLYLQDEARIAAMLDWNEFFLAAMVLTILFLILWRSSRLMKLNLKAIGYYTVLSVFAILIVIFVSKI